MDVNILYVKYIHIRVKSVDIRKNTSVFVDRIEKNAKCPNINKRLCVCFIGVRPQLASFSGSRIQRIIY